VTEALGYSEIVFGRVGRSLMAAQVPLVCAVLSNAVAARAEPSAGFPLPPEENAPPPPAQAAPPAPPARATTMPPMVPTQEPWQAAPPVEPVPVPPAAAPAEAAAPPPSGYPLVLPYREGVPVPRGYHVEERPASGLLWTGGVAWGVGYAAGLGLAMSESFENGTGWTVLPLIGPFAAIGAREFKCRVNGDDIDDIDDVDDTADEAERCIRRAQTEAISIALLAADGMVQVTGALLFAAGLASGTKELVWDGIGKLKVSARARPEGGAELELRGRF
jgi:hypothetical protein